MLRDSLAKFFKVDSLIENLTGYVEARIDLVKVEAKEGLSKGISSLAVYLIIAFLVSLVIIFLSIACAILVGESLGMVWGFVIVALIYAICAAAVFSKRKSLLASVEKEVSLRIKKIIK